MIAIVVDTNVFVAAFLKGGKPLLVLQTAQQAKTVLLTTTALEGEVFEVIQRPKFKRHFEEQGVNPTQLLSDYSRVTRKVTPVKI
jgi:predicted nucleic acid-binding protein